MRRMTSLVLVDSDPALIRPTIGNDSYSNSACYVGHLPGVRPSWSVVGISEITKGFVFMINLRFLPWYRPVRRDLSRMANWRLTAGESERFADKRSSKSERAERG